MSVSKPSVLPRWAITLLGALSSRVEEPPSGKKDVGWAPGDTVPAEWLNWLFVHTYKWIEWLQDIENQAITWTARHTMSNGLDVDQGVTVTGGATVSDGQTVNGGQVVNDGQTVNGDSSYANKLSIGDILTLAKSIVFSSVWSAGSYPELMSWFDGAGESVRRVRIYPGPGLHITVNARQSAPNVWVADNTSQNSHRIWIGGVFGGLNYHAAKQGSDPALNFDGTNYLFRVDARGAVTVPQYSVTNTIGTVEAGSAVSGTARIVAGTSSTRINTTAASLAAQASFAVISQATADSTATSLRTVVSNGYLTVYSNANATGNVNFSWFILGSGALNNPTST
jgi:hypothetical protein